MYLYLNFQIGKVKYRFKFSHVNGARKMFELKIPFPYPYQPSRGATLCQLEKMTKGVWKLLGSSISYCNHADRWDRKRGSKESLKKLFKSNQLIIKKPNGKAFDFFKNKLNRYDIWQALRYNHNVVNFTKKT